VTDQGSLDFKPQPQPDDDLRPAAEEALAVAERLDRRHDPAAEHAFAEAEGFAVKCADMEIQIRVFESSGGFYERRKAFTIAAEKYRVSLQSAQCLSGASDTGAEDAYRLRFKLLGVQKRDDKGWKNLKEVALPTDTYQARCAAWTGYVDDIDCPAGRLAARGLGSKDDFRRRLDAAKLNSSDNENDE
jgi:hypothetical protein